MGIPALHSRSWVCDDSEEPSPFFLVRLPEGAGRRQGGRRRVVTALAAVRRRTRRGAAAGLGAAGRGVRAARSPRARRTARRRALLGRGGRLGRRRRVAGRRGRGARRRLGVRSRNVPVRLGRLGRRRLVAVAVGPRAGTRRGRRGLDALPVHHFVRRLAVVRRASAVGGARRGNPRRRHLVHQMEVEELASHRHRGDAALAPVRELRVVRQLAHGDQAPCPCLGQVLASDHLVLGRERERLVLLLGQDVVLPVDLRSRVELPVLPEDREIEPLRELRRPAGRHVLPVAVDDRLRDGPVRHTRRRNQVLVHDVPAVAPPVHADECPALGLVLLGRHLHGPDGDREVGRPPELRRVTRVVRDADLTRPVRPVLHEEVEVDAERGPLRVARRLLVHHAALRLRRLRCLGRRRRGDLGRLLDVEGDRHLTETDVATARLRDDLDGDPPGLVARVRGRANVRRRQVVRQDDQYRPAGRQRLEPPLQHLMLTVRAPVVHDGDRVRQSHDDRAVTHPQTEGRVPRRVAGLLRVVRRVGLHALRADGAEPHRRRQRVDVSGAVALAAVVDRDLAGCAGGWRARAEREHETRDDHRENGGQVRELHLPTSPVVVVDVGS